MPEYPLIEVFGVTFVVTFLLGSIPWGVIISKLFYRTDIREHGSGNIGATNALRTLGKTGGAVVLLLDFGKGVLSGLVGSLAVYYIMMPEVYQSTALTLSSAFIRQIADATAFVGCILGHVFSPWLKFKGGKGIAVAIGCLLCTFGPLSAFIELAIFALLLAITRYVSVGSLVAAVVCPFLALWQFWGNASAIVLCTIAALIVIWAHRTNIVRLRAGTESRINAKKA